MADEANTIAARLRARFQTELLSETPAPPAVDPVLALLDTWERQSAFWDQDPALIGPRKDKMMGLSQGMTENLLSVVQPTTVPGAIAALRCSLKLLKTTRRDCRGFHVDMMAHALARLEIAVKTGRAAES